MWVSIVILINKHVDQFISLSCLAVPKRFYTREVDLRLESTAQHIHSDCVDICNWGALVFIIQESGLIMWNVYSAPVGYCGDNGTSTSTSSCWGSYLFSNILFSNILFSNIFARSRQRSELFISGPRCFSSSAYV